MILVLSAGFSAVPLYKAFVRPQANKDYSLWYQTGLAVRHGEPLYPDRPGKGFAYMYPPFPAVLIFSPLSLLGPAVMAAILVTTNAVAWVVCVFLSVYLCTGSWAIPSLGRACLPLAITAPYVWDTFVLGQINLVLLAMVLLAFVAERNGKSIAAGVLIGLAGAIKVFPVLILPYLVWKRRWGASVVAGVTLVFFSVLAPAAVRGFHRNATEVWTWIDGMVLNETGEQIGQRPESGFMACNQSLMALTQRLLRPVKAGQHLDAFFRVNVVDVAPWLAQAVFFCAAAALCLTFCVCVRRRRAAGALENGLELSMLLCLVVLLTPLAWTYFYCWMLLPWTAVTLGIAGLWQEPRARWTILAGCAFSLALFAGALSQGVDQRPQALGVTTLGAVVLFVCLASLQRRSALNDAGLAVAA